MLKNKTMQAVFQRINSEKRGITIAQLQKELGFCKETIRHHVDILFAVGEIDCWTAGNVRIFCKKPEGKKEGE